MTDFFIALSTNPILLASLFAAFLASISSGIMGSYIVVKRNVFIAGSIAHAVLGGIGLALWLDRVQGIAWLTPLSGALLAAILSALIMGWIHLYYKERDDSVIAALWSIGMAAGILFISQTPGSNVELSNYLVGNILWVTPSDLKVLAILDAIVLLVVFKFHKKFLLLCFDENQAKLQGVNVPALYLLLLVLASVTIVLLIQVVGVILVMTILTIPAAIAGLMTSRLSRMMGLAVILSALFCFLGNWTAFVMDWPIGATIALIAGGAY
ncbi:MAG: metal ABC transporter permease, partial [Chlamydiia bacterium]|nr:metal ABC transporter permease [Chlamydiia bacterium]